MNPILQTLNQGNMSRLGQVKQMAQAFKATSNPQVLASRIIQNNPKITQIINQYGGDPKTAFYKYAEANGIDPDEVLNMLK